jgi:RND family efflux transporter MFP subunit
MAAAMPGSIVLRAPAAGRILSATASPGATASPKGDPLFHLAVDSLPEIDAEVPGLYLADLKDDQVATIEVPHHPAVPGRVRRIGAEIDAVSQMGHIRIGLEPTPLLRFGSFVRATVEARQSCGVSIPRAAILDGSDGSSVQVVRGHSLETRRVTVGLVSLRNAEIQQGLKVGDIVVAHAGTSLRDSDVVTPKFEEPGSDKDPGAR